MEYYIDNDPGYGLANDITFSGTTDVNASFSINLAALSEGVHVIGVRSRTDNGWSLDNKWIFLKPYTTGSASAVPNITQVEYFVDNDPGYGNATPVSISPGQDIADIAINLSLQPLTEGVHLVGVRSRDANGTWGLDNKWIFLKPYLVSGSGPAPNINRVEYFVDNDPGYGNATPLSLTPGQDVAGLSFNIDLLPLTEGVHLLGARSQDANGAWSIDNKWIFLKPYTRPSGAQVPAIDRVEYYVDTDPGYGNATSLPITPGQDLSGLGFSLNLPDYYEGVHILAVRSRDANGAWSQDNRWLFLKPYTSTITAARVVTKMEYYINNDPGYGNGVPVALTPGGDINGKPIFANITDLPAGQHYIYLRSRDDQGAWSLDNRWSITLGASVAPPVINISSYSLTTICKEGNFTLGYDASGTYNSGNQFVAEMSDAAGSFDSPVAIGSITSANDGLIPCVIPADASNGGGYRIRVRSTNPAITGESNPLPITVYKFSIGNDTTVFVVCNPDTYNLNTLYNFEGVKLWNTPNPAAAPLGSYQVILTTQIGCKDTANTMVTQDVSTWTGASSNNWFTPANWSTGKIPTAATHVIVGTGTPNPCVISGANATVASVRLNGGASITIQPGFNLMVKGTCDNLPAP